MGQIKILSWNIQGNDPYVIAELLAAVDAHKPDIVFVCEVGETALWHYVANLWTEDALLATAVRGHQGLLSPAERESLDRIDSVLSFQQRPNVIRPATFPVENPPTLVAQPSASTYTTHLRTVYGWDASLLNAESLLNENLTTLRDTLGRQGTTVDRRMTVQGGAHRLHRLHQLYPHSEWFEMDLQQNRNYLVLWKDGFGYHSQRALLEGSKRPLVIFRGSIGVMFTHAIAREGAAKKQLREAAQVLREMSADFNSGALLTGDLNCDAETLRGDPIVADAMRRGLQLLTTGRPTQYSGGELDYALTWGIPAIRTRIEVLDTFQSDHRAILLTVENS